MRWVRGLRASLVPPPGRARPPPPPPPCPRLPTPCPRLPTAASRPECRAAVGVARLRTPLQMGPAHSSGEPSALYSAHSPVQRSMSAIGASGAKASGLAQSRPSLCAYTYTYTYTCAVQAIALRAAESSGGEGRRGGPKESVGGGWARGLRARAAAEANGAGGLDRPRRTTQAELHGSACMSISATMESSARLRSIARRWLSPPVTNPSGLMPYSSGDEPPTAAVAPR